jgi:uncharacterized protein YlxW (UPF0749 family)
MERTGRNEKDDAQKAKLVFFSLAALVAVLLIWSIASGSKARSERDAAKQELEMSKSDVIKLEQMVKDLNTENEGLKKKVQQLEAKVKAKAKPASVKKKSAPSKSSTKKSKKRK